MAISYVQNSTNAVCNPNYGIASPALDAIAVVGGATGGTETITFSGTVSNGGSGNFEIIPASGVSWDAGTWTVNLNVTTANMNISWNGFEVIKYSSTCSGASIIANEVNSAVVLGSTGVVTKTVSGASATPAAGDKIIIKLYLSNGAMSSQSVVFTMNQNIDSPFSVPAVFIAPKPFIVNQSVKRASFY